MFSRFNFYLKHRAKVYSAPHHQQSIHYQNMYKQIWHRLMQYRKHDNDIYVFSIIAFDNSTMIAYFYMIKQRLFSYYHLLNCDDWKMVDQSSYVLDQSITPGIAYKRRCNQIPITVSELCTCHHIYWG